MAEKGESVSAVNEAHLLMEKGYYDRALMIFARIASLGVESAQHNTAYILSRKYFPSSFKPLPLPLVSTTTTDTSSSSPSEQQQQQQQTHTYKTSYAIETPYYPYSSHIHSHDVSSTSTASASSSSSSHKYNLTRNQECQLRGLYMYTLSARQGNAESYVRVGDSYYYGQGGLTPNKQDAASYYQLAAEMRHTHAIFNLGLMYEIGDGVTQDFHLAKRFYDQAAQFDVNAQLPRAVALTVLDVHKYLQQIMGQERVSELLITVRHALESVVYSIVKIKQKVNYYFVHGSVINTEEAEEGVSEGDQQQQEENEEDDTNNKNQPGHTIYTHKQQQPKENNIENFIISNILDNILYSYDYCRSAYKRLRHHIYDIEIVVREVATHGVSYISDEVSNLRKHYDSQVKSLLTTLLTNSITSSSSHSDDYSEGGVDSDPQRQRLLQQLLQELDDKTVQMISNSILILYASLIWLLVYYIKLYRQRRRREARQRQIILQQQQQQRQHVHQE